MYIKIFCFIVIGYCVQYSESHHDNRVNVLGFLNRNHQITLHESDDDDDDHSKKHIVVHKHEHKHHHKHDHGHKHGHKHDASHHHHHKAKHSHKHEAKHQHHHNAKHGHKHEHKHSHKHEAKHEHKHEAKHGHNHKHGHHVHADHHHKHGHHQKHKHEHKHNHHDKHHKHDDVLDHENIELYPVTDDFGPYRIDGDYEDHQNQEEYIDHDNLEAFDADFDSPRANLEDSDVDFFSAQKEPTSLYSYNTNDQALASASTKVTNNAFTDKPKTNPSNKYESLAYTNTKHANLNSPWTPITIAKEQMYESSKAVKSKVLFNDIKKDLNDSLKKDVTVTSTTTQKTTDESTKFSRFKYNRITPKKAPSVIQT